MQDPQGKDSQSLWAVWLTASGWLMGPLWGPATSGFGWGPEKGQSSRSLHGLMMTSQPLDSTVL